MNFIPKIEYTELGTGTPKSFTFDTPPEGDPVGESRKALQKSRRSTGGVRQTQYNYGMEERKLTFIFQSQAVMDAYNDFYDNHASRGGDFNFFEHSDELGFELFELVIRTSKIKRPIPSAVLGEFEYDFKFGIERVI